MFRINTGETFGVNGLIPRNGSAAHIAPVELRNLLRPIQTTCTEVDFIISNWHMGMGEEGKQEEERDETVYAEIGGHFLKDLEDENYEIICEFLLQAQNLKKLTLGYQNRLSDDRLQKLLNVIIKLPIEELSLNGAQLTKQQFEAFVLTLRHFQCLKNIDLAWVSRGLNNSPSIDTICKVVNDISHLEEINLRTLDLDRFNNTELKLLGQVLASHRSLKKISISESLENEQKFGSFMTALQNSATITEVDVLEGTLPPRLEAMCLRNKNRGQIFQLTSQSSSSSFSGASNNNNNSNYKYK